MSSAPPPRPAATGPATAPPRTVPWDGAPERFPCEFCGQATLSWRKCKLVCASCGNINKSCADL